MSDDSDVQRALDEGARRSRQASSLTRAERTVFDAMSVPGGTVARHRSGQLPVEREVLTPEVLWRRFKWPIIALGLFALLELLSLGKLVTVMGTHF